MLYEELTNVECEWIILITEQKDRQIKGRNYLSGFVCATIKVNLTESLNYT